VKAGAFRSTALALVTAVLLASSSAHAGGPSAADKETARSMMDQGFRLRDAKDLKGALQRFTAADQIMHVPSTGYEVARAQLDLGMLVEASDTATRVINTPPARREPIQFREARKKAQALVDSLQGRIPALTVVLEGAKPGEKLDLSIDDTKVPAAVIGLPRSVDPGHHVLVVTTDTTQGRAEIDVAEGEQKSVTITMKPSAHPVVASHPPVESAGPPPPVVKIEEHHGKGGKIAAFVSFGLGGAALIAGGVTGGLALVTRSDLADKCTNHQCSPAQAGELSDGNTFAWISTFAFAGGAAALVVGVIVLAVSGHKHAAPQSAYVTPWIGPTGAGISGAF
jgi:hypothetical protein